MTDCLCSPGDAAAYGASEGREPPPVSARIGSQYYTIYTQGGIQVNTSTGVERSVRSIERSSDAPTTPSSMDIEGYATSCSFADGVLTVEVELAAEEQPRETEAAPADAALLRRVIEIKAEGLRLVSVDSLKEDEMGGSTSGGGSIGLQKLAQRLSTEAEYADLTDQMEQAAAGQAVAQTADIGWIPVGTPCPIKSIVLQLPNESRSLLGEAAEKLLSSRRSRRACNTPGWPLARKVSDERKVSN